MGYLQIVQIAEQSALGEQVAGGPVAAIVDDYPFKVGAGLLLDAGQSVVSEEGGPVMGGSDDGNLGEGRLSWRETALMIVDI